MSKIKKKNQRVVVYSPDSSEDESSMENKSEENNEPEEHHSSEKVVIDRLSRSSDLISKFESSHNPMIEGKHIFGYDIYPQSARDLTEKHPETILTMEKDDYGKTSFDYAIQKNWMWAFELAPSALTYEAVFRLFLNDDARLLMDEIMYKRPEFQTPSFVEMALLRNDYDFERLPRETKHYIEKNAYKFTDRQRFQKFVKSMIQNGAKPTIDAHAYNTLNFQDCCPDFLHPESYFSLVDS